ncbi:hypothetical protein KAJ87_00375 [Candidatus Pacearchaeota archaeon]|nr:hypothetical protein [Candidatus Pacearchaeota archaeon]
MKKKITIGILGILSIVIVSASFIPYFGKITGTATIEGPVFYLSAPEDLILNDNSSLNENDFNITKENNATFITDDLGINKFYSAQFNNFIWAKKNNETSYLKIEIIKTNGIDKEIVCDSGIIIIKSTNFQKQIISCSSNEEINLSSKNKLGIKISGMAKIRVGHEYSAGYSRIEVSAT